MPRLIADLDRIAALHLLRRVFSKELRTMIQTRRRARGCTTVCSVIGIFMLIGSARASTQVPVIKSVSPTTASAGQKITVSGSGFGAIQGSNYVTFNDAGTNWGAPGSETTWAISSWSNTKIVFIMPSLPSGRQVVPNTWATVMVTVAGVNSNAEYILIPYPTIKSLSPTAAVTGRTITVTGSGFGTTQGNSYVTFNDAGINWGVPGNAATVAINSWSNSQIVFTLPNSSAQYPVVPNAWATVTVTVAGVNSQSLYVWVQPSVAITSVSPSTASAGQTITVTGSGFGATQGSSYATFSDGGTNWNTGSNSANWAVSSWSNNQIVFTLPNSSSQYPVIPNTWATVTVTVGGVTSNLEYVLIPYPEINSVSPTTALAGQAITITGSGFGTTEGNGYVTFNDAGTNWGAPGNAIPLVISSWSNNQIVFTVPDPSGLTQVVPNTWATATVTVSGVNSNYEYLWITQPVNVYTRSYNLARTGANLNENILTPSNVNPTQFGKLFTVNTDGEMYAQPLYVANLLVGGAVHNVAFVATMNNSIYAIDADNGTILWNQNYGTPIVADEVENDLNIAWTSGIGILSTPVIDPTTNYMYFVHGTELPGAGHEYQLEAINIYTGNRVFSPATVSGSYMTADLTSPLIFNPTMQNQRSSLALANGNVYFAFGSHEDQSPYQGWVFAYSASTFAQIGVYSDVTLGNGGGIWMAGSAPAVDASGNVFLSSGNGTFGPTPQNLVQTGNSFIKFSPTLQVLDYFTPNNSAALNSNDMDLGSGGVMLVPNPSNPQAEGVFVAGGGKEGVLYLVNPNQMGEFNASQDQVVQEFQAVYGTGTSHIHGTPVYFNSAANGPSLYVWGENDYLRGFQFNAAGGLLTTTPFGESTMTAPVTNANGAMPGGFLAISANGGTNGIVWASTPYSGDASHAVVQGVLYAFNANTMQELWSDKDNDARDEIGLFAKHCPPVVVNGKLYMSTFGPLATGTTTASGQLVVYGLLP
jgi:hypothetical protein